MEMEEDPFHSLPSSSLLPPLPNELALLCLARLPRVCHGLLRCVNATWNRALSCPQFFRHRALHGSADVSVLAVFEHHTPKGTALPVQCVEVDLASGLNSRPLASWTHEQATQMFLRGQACIQMGPAILFAGGYAWHKDQEGSGSNSSLKPTDRMWRLCMLTRAAWGVASMSVPRASFAWAVFGSDLVVVAGGECAPGEWTTGVEAYCPARDEWVPLAPMPARVKIQYYFVRGGQLLIGGKAVGGGGPGREMVLAYDPTSGTWACPCPEPWMRSLCHDTCCATVATDDAIICASLRVEATFFTDESLSTCLRVSRLRTHQKPPATTTTTMAMTTTTMTTTTATASSEWETMSILDRVCTPSVFALHSTASSAILVLPYDLSTVNYYGNWNHNPNGGRIRSAGTTASDIVLKSSGAAGLVQVCVRCCYCFRCHFSSALITL